MTAQEAIEKFKRIKRGNIFLIHQRIEGKEVIEDYSLCDMAISALQAQDLQSTCNQLATDCVSRQTAIDAMCSACGYDCDKSEFVYNAPQDEQIILCPEHYALTSLPSAQAEPLHINLNEWVKAKLTDLGKEIYYHQYDELNKTYGREMLNPRFPKEDENGYTRFQLWEFIQLYGSHIGMGAPNVIDPLEIVYEGEFNE